MFSQRCTQVLLPLLAFFLAIDSTQASDISYVSRRAEDDKGKGSWRRHSLLGQVPRQENSVTAVGEKVYVLGGVAYNEASKIETLNRVEFYDVPDKTWHIAAPLPTPLNHGNVATWDSKVYMLGALSGGHDWTAMADTFAYEPFNDTWTDLAPSPNGTARGSSAVGVCDGKIYLAGGMTLLQAYIGGHQNSVSTVSSYDISSDTWNLDLPSLPQPRQHVGGAVVGSTFYVIGGRENGVYQYHNSTYALDLKNPTSWTERASVPTARGSLSCAAIGDKIYCFGGEGNPDNADRIFNETQVYDTRSDKWQTLAPMEVPRHGTGAVAVGDQIFISGGGVTTAFFPTGIFDSFVP